MDLTYTRNDDYLFPALYLEDADPPIGKYGLSDTNATFRLK